MQARSGPHAWHDGPPPHCLHEPWTSTNPSPQAVQLPLVQARQPEARGWAVQGVQAPEVALRKTGASAVSSSP